MKKFAGFPSRMRFTPVPDLFLNRLLPEITDIAELKTVLCVFSLLYHKRGYPRYVSLSELLTHKGLVDSLNGSSPEEALRVALEGAVRRGILLSLSINRNGTEESIYFLNDQAGRDAIARIQRGELAIAGVVAIAKLAVSAGPPPDIFTMYEENVGMLTPIIADELRQAEKLYPPGWIQDAIKAAAEYNRRSWRYIAAILERWSQEGKPDGAYRRDSKTDPDKYFKGRYGHMVRR